MRLLLTVPALALLLVCCSHHAPDVASDTGTSAGKYRPVIPLTVWLPPKNSALTDHYRKYYEGVLKDKHPNAPVAAVLRRRTGALEELFVRADDPSLDGADAEGYAHDLVFALAVTGDDHFAEALTVQPVRRRRELASRILFGFGSLDGKAPKTEAFCRRYDPVSYKRYHPAG